MKLISIIFSLLFVFTVQVSAQDIEGYREQEIEAYKSKAEDQVRFLEFLLNTLGSKDASTRDKDVIITESYLKIFRDRKVQIEDDLTENRNVLINKDVTAYLKDIDFFFETAKFDFEINSTEAFLRDNGDLSFKVELIRTLKATGIEGEPILNTKKRFIEINLNEEEDELQIASIYTTKVSRDKAIIGWWNSLSLAWKDIFKTAMQFQDDSLDIAQLQMVVASDSLNLASNYYIVSLSPLSFLVDLQYLNLSNTNIDDIAPLRSLTELQHLDISNTVVKDLSFLRYAENIEHLDLSFTPVQKIEALENLTALKHLHLKGTDITEFEVLINFKEIRILDLSETFFDQPELLSAMGNVKEINMSRSNLSKLTDEMSSGTLEELDISYAFISDISPLKDYQQLRTVNISNTQVEDLSPLGKLNKLEKIYADNTFVNEEDVEAFIDANPNKLLIVNSEELSKWWSNLDPNWQEALSFYIDGEMNEAPKKEQLTRLLLKDSLNLNDKNIGDLSPVQKFSRLRYLSISNNPIENLAPIEGLNALIYLEAKNIGLKSVSPIMRLTRLRRLDISRNDLEPEQFLDLAKLNSLNELNVDRSGIDKDLVAEFLVERGTECTVIYDTEGVANWWKELDQTWQSILRLQFPLSISPTQKELHDLIAVGSIVIVDEDIQDLRPLSQFILLEKVHLERVEQLDLESVGAMRKVKELSITKCPIRDIGPLKQLYYLEKLTLDFTAVSDLGPLEEMQSVEHLSLAGTQVRNLRGIENLTALEYLDISSTQVRWIGKLEELTGLQVFKCYNTRILDFSLNNFKEEHPECEVVFY